LHGFAKILRYALKCIQFLLGAALGDVLMHKIYYISVFLVIALPLNLFAEQKFYGIYSNMMASDGEPSGFEMFFLHDGRAGRCSESVIFQYAEGWPEYPELLDCCGCSENHIEFVSKQLGKFKGKIENENLIGEFIETKQRVFLKKGQSFWQKQ